ncbi:MAG: lipid-A-disaccharide synthase N-terminal domain-containing protein [Alloprevotella sp.]
MSSIYVYAIGFAAQLFFSARILVQWIMTERARHVLSPTLFWVLSLLGSYLLCLYGWLRTDFSIVLGQFVSYYIYMWNLRAKGVWSRLPWIVTAVLLLTPVAAIAWVSQDAAGFVRDFLRNEEIPWWMVCWGSIGQLVFTLRFVYQFVYSRRRGESVLPAGFWIMSLTGSLLIVSYGVARLDPVLILGQSFGLVAYSRNLWIGTREKRSANSLNK